MFGFVGLLIKIVFTQLYKLRIRKEIDDRNINENFYNSIQFFSPTKTGLIGE